VDPELEESSILDAGYTTLLVVRTCLKSGGVEKTRNKAKRERQKLGRKLFSNINTYSDDPLVNGDVGAHVIPQHELVVISDYGPRFRMSRVDENKRTSEPPRLTTRRVGPIIRCVRKESP
jgi:hypothetical protein